MEECKGEKGGLGTWQPEKFLFLAEEYTLILGVSKAEKEECQSSAVFLPFLFWIHYESTHWNGATHEGECTQPFLETLLDIVVSFDNAQYISSSSEIII